MSSMISSRARTAVVPEEEEAPMHVLDTLLSQQDPSVPSGHHITAAEILKIIKEFLSHFFRVHPADHQPQDGGSRVPQF